MGVRVLAVYHSLKMGAPPCFETWVHVRQTTRRHRARGVRFLICVLQVSGSNEGWTSVNVTGTLRVYLSSSGESCELVGLRQVTTLLLRVHFSSLFAAVVKSSDALWTELREINSRRHIPEDSNASKVNQFSNEVTNL